MDLDARLKNRDALTDLLDEVFSTKSTEDWVDHFKGTLPVAPVYDLEKALNNPFIDEIGSIAEVDHPDRSNLRGLNNPLRLDGERVPLKPGPKLGADTADILQELGRSAEDIEALQAKKIV